ncbi:MAG TPA: SDR family NAD(P)-dependent oxidoreductase [Acidimicrobiales bacterium]|nr:SDR family NAD(P)-dependent oxidoreductase [Acidimicrobiales bacterium]
MSDPALPRNIVLTGASAGIGAAAAIELTRRGHPVTAVGRSAPKLAAVHSRMLAVAPGGLEVPEPETADFATLAGVRALADTLLERCPRIDVLANNAGLIVPRRQETADGFEMTFAVNHLAPFLLTNLLVGRVAESGGRVVTTSSDAHKGGKIYEDDLQLRRFGRWKAYCQSKLANVLFTSELARRTGLPATCFHPGLVRTDFGRGSFVKVLSTVIRPLYRTPEQGAETLVWLATDPEGGAPTATYYADCTPGKPTAMATDPELARRLWDTSATLVGLPAS